jgi:hypothetical protein
MTYQYADGYDNAGSLADFTPQPKSTGLFRAYRRVPVTRRVKADGDLRCTLTWTVLDYDEYETILTQCGVTIDNPSNEGTWRLRTGESSWANYNGILVINQPPDIQRAIGFWQNIVASLYKLEAL